ncbi:outer membrane protein [Mesorhizobium sp. ANAO-SY3R2]|uniref:outer membrane protein n=1 Tax=Mesorhizobium sp. ANAO-SY3R2 TaxID=3166644 RepID=UPI0036701B90
MKTILLASTFLFAVAGTPYAADASGKLPVASTYNWSGFYIGANVGAVFDGPNQSFYQSNAAPFSATQFAPVAFDRGTPSDAVGGAHVGYNWQVAPNWVLGIEGDYNHSGMAKAASRQLDSSPPGIAGSNFVTMADRLRWLASIRGRVAYATDNWLFYGTGGIAIAEQRFQGGIVNGLVSVPVTSIQSEFSSGSTGWVAGAGIEWRHGGITGCFESSISSMGCPAKQARRRARVVPLVVSTTQACLPGTLTISKLRVLV